MDHGARIPIIIHVPTVSSSARTDGSMRCQLAQENVLAKRVPKKALHKTSWQKKVPKQALHAAGEAILDFQRSRIRVVSKFCSRGICGPLFATFLEAYVKHGLAVGEQLVLLVIEIAHDLLY